MRANNAGYNEQTIKFNRQSKTSVKNKEAKHKIQIKRVPK